ncbi:MAG: PAS domain S-box protein, partial [Myxococcota bacterium]
MMRFRDRPIRAKLLVIVVATTAAALVVSVTLSILYEYFALRERFALDQSILTRITANNATAAVAFKSASDAQEVLERLGDDPSILVAEIVTPDGRVLASYRRSGVDKELDAPRIPGDERYSFDADTLITAAEIRTESLALGTVFVRSDLAVINSFLARDAMISFALAVLACALAAGAAALLQRSISRPIRQLSDVADQVTRDEMHRGRATKLGDDEVGRLVDSFNGMLDRIRQREIALAESEANYRMLSEQASDGILLWTEDQRIQFANPAACEMLGYSEPELRNLRMSDVFERGDGEARIPTLDELHEGKAVPSEGPCRRKDGSELWTESRSKMLEDGRVQSIVRDLSERHEMESRLRQAQRMETVGQLAGGVAHDFNNLLTVISGGCELALDRGDLSAEDAEEISDVARAAQRAAS